jgi:hypothetical protein
MYYSESENLIKEKQENRQAVKSFDREIAHTYAPNSGGQTEIPLLQYKTGLSLADINRLLNYYEEANILIPHQEVECECGNLYENSEETCVECGLEIESAIPTEKIFYRVIKQPEMPAYNPDLQTSTPDIFISYRVNDTGKLAADIFYSLRAEGYSAFLDKGEIPVGANAERVFLQAASRANYFIALISQNYFDSDFCKKEFAHSMRRGNRLIRINVPPLPEIPNDMPWVGSPNWLSQNGNADGLSPVLEISLITAVRTPGHADIDDLRKQACQFLLDKLSPQDTLSVWNRLLWMTESFGNPPASKQERINLILQEAVGGKLLELCNTLAP